MSTVADLVKKYETLDARKNEINVELNELQSKQTALNLELNEVEDGLQTVKIDLSTELSLDGKIEQRQKKPNRAAKKTPVVERKLSVGSKKSLKNVIYDYAAQFEEGTTFVNFVTEVTRLIETGKYKSNAQRPYSPIVQQAIHTLKKEKRMKVAGKDADGKFLYKAI